MSINFFIKGTNGYSYYFKSDNNNILFNFDNISLNNNQKEISMYDQHMEILFNLDIYEYNNNFFEFSNNDIIFSEKFHVDINFKFLKFYKENDDFSFGFIYNIDDLNKDMLFYFENIDKLNTFKYTLFEETNELYNKSTLLYFIKSNLLLNLDKEIKKLLVYYPENDSLFYLKSIFDYLKREPFFLNLEVNLLLTINYCEVKSFKYEQIIKNNRTIFLKNITTSMKLEGDYYNFEGERIYSLDEVVTIIIDFISIDKNKKIEYFMKDKDKEYALDALKLIVNTTEKILDKKNI